MTNFFVELNHLDVLAVSGPDSAKFLQGQVTCDVASSSDTNTTRGAICNNKGRVLGNFLLLRDGETCYLEMNQGLLAPIRTTLDRFIVFYKAETGDVSDSFQRLGLAGDEAKDLLLSMFETVPGKAGEVCNGKDHHLCLISGGSRDSLLRYELWLSADTAPGYRETISAALPQASTQRWELEDIRSGMLNISPELSGEYTPQLLNYDLIGLVSFTKGCYTGQEIVARMHYRGTPKKRLVHFRTVAAPDQADCPGVGDPVWSEDGETGLGVIMKVLSQDSTIEGLALVETGKVGNNRGFLGEGRLIPVKLTFLSGE